jgi:Transposase DDE domain
MTHDSLLNDDWNRTIERLGGAEALVAGARATKAFAWGRKLRNPLVMLRLVLAYCLGEWGLRSTATWAAAIGLADISNVALLYRLQRCGDWLALLVGDLLAQRAPQQSRGRLIRIIDGSSVPKAGRAAKRQNGLWRIHAAFDLPSERFGDFVLTDEHGGEQVDRIAVVKGEIRLADRVHLQPDRIANVLHDGGDIIVRAGWKAARWQQQTGAAFDLLDAFRNAASGRIDQPIWIARTQGPALALRLIAMRKSDTAAAEARRKARRQAQKDGNQISTQTLAAADWVILVTSLPATDFSADDVLALYRLRWRVELGFKRLKSVIGLHGPPGADERSARPYILAQLLALLLLEPSVDALEDSPHWACAA